MSTTRGLMPILDFLNGGQYGQRDDQTTNTNGYGASLQISDVTEWWGRANNLVAGVSFDGAQTTFDATFLIGGLTADTRVFYGPGMVIDEPGTNTPVRVSVSNAYYGVFASDTYSLTPKLAATLAGRFNNAQITLNDLGGGNLNGGHIYSRFNPSAGVVYRFARWLSAYASYSEANRAPTPSELSCANPQDACSLANFFVGDPQLKQVVAHTVEAGVRGGLTILSGTKLDYDMGFYHTNLNDDIVFVNSVALGRAFFTNVGLTRRQGVDAGVQLTTDRWVTYLNYAYVQATYQSGFIESAGNNRAADANGNIQVRPGDRLPGIPANQIKLGVQYKVTDVWTLGATGLAASGAYLFGDPANLTAKLPGYFVLNLNTSYQITPHMQIFGLVQNATDAKYYTHGTFSPIGSVYLAQAPNATNPRSYSPAAQVAGYGGLRVTF